MRSARSRLCVWAVAVWCRWRGSVGSGGLVRTPVRTSRVWGHEMCDPPVLAFFVGGASRQSYIYTNIRRIAMVTPKGRFPSSLCAASAYYYRTTRIVHRDKRCDLRASRGMLRVVLRFCCVTSGVFIPLHAHAKIYYVATFAFGRKVARASQAKIYARRLGL